MSRSGKKKVDYSELWDAFSLNYVFYNLPSYIFIPALVTFSLIFTVIFGVVTDYWRFYLFYKAPLLSIVFVHGWIFCGYLGVTAYERFPHPLVGFACFVIGFIVWVYVYVYLLMIQVINI